MTSRVGVKERARRFGDARVHTDGTFLRASLFSICDEPLQRFSPDEVVEPWALTVDDRA